MASLSSSLPQDLTRPQQPKLKTTPKKKQRDQQQNEQKQRSVNANNNKYIIHRRGYSTNISMRGDITIKSAVLLLLLPTILYTVVIITLFINTPQPTMRDMPSCNRAKLLNTNECDAKVQAEVCNKILNKMKIFKRRVTKRNKKKKQFSMRVAGYATYKKYVKSIGG